MSGKIKDVLSKRRYRWPLLAVLSVLGLWFAPARHAKRFVKRLRRVK